MHGFLTKSRNMHPDKTCRVTYILREISEKPKQHCVGERQDKMCRNPPTHFYPFSGENANRMCTGSPNPRTAQCGTLCSILVRRYPAHHPKREARRNCMEASLIFCSPIRRTWFHRNYQELPNRLCLEVRPTLVP